MQNTAHKKQESITTTKAGYQGLPTLWFRTVNHQPVIVVLFCDITEIWNLRFLYQWRCWLWSSTLWHHILLQAVTNVSTSSVKTDVIHSSETLVNTYKTTKCTTHNTTVNIIRFIYFDFLTNELQWLPTFTIFY
jgi:hypothetical protein